MSRRGTTLVEALVAGGVFLVVMAGAWAVFQTSRKQAEQVLEYSDILQSATSVSTRLQLDFAAAWVPPGGDLNSSAFDVAADGKGISFLRSPRVEDVDAVPPAGPGRRLVRWTTQARPDGYLTLTRELPGPGGEKQTWPSAPLKDLRFLVYKVDGQLYAVAEFLFLRPERAAGGGNEREFPIRLVRHLGRFSAAPAGLPSAPAPLLPPGAPDPGVLPFPVPPAQTGGGTL